MTTSIKDKIVLITGASSGIGWASAELFASLGARIILAARRIDRLETLSTQLQNRYQTNTLTLQLDVRERAQVENAISSLPPSWQSIDILLNSAGLALGSDLLQEGTPSNWDNIIQVNVCGLLYMTRAILPGMIERNTGHIINISSTAGHECYPRGNVYSATKHAVNALSKSLRLDLLGTPLRVTNVSPGMAETEFSQVRWKDVERAKRFYEGFTPLSAEDIADAIVYAATRPPHVDVSEMVIFPTAQASVHHVHKKDSVQQDLFR